MRIIKEYRNCAGEYHRLGGPAITWSDGSESWWVNGKTHRLDGPAVISDGSESWWVNGKTHRLDGPAVIFTNGDQDWWINDIKITNEVRNWMEECNISTDYTKWTDGHRVLFRLRF